MFNLFKEKLIKQGSPYFFNHKAMIFHLAFTNICNQKCPYCTEGNFSENKIILDPTRKEDMIGAIDKIFDAYDETYELGFILVGGEPTMQDCFVDVVNKIKTRKNAYMVLTTNFTQSVEYYRNLDIPLITSMHLEFHEPKDWFEKTLELRDLILETRIMAHPKKMDKVKEAYELFNNASEKYSLSFSVERIDPVEIEGKNGTTITYEPKYKQEDIDWIKNHLTVRRELPQSLKEKSGFMSDIFYGATWQYSDGTEKKLQFEENKFKGWYCDRNFLFMYSDGRMIYGWSCESSTHNLFKEDCFPKKEVGPLICNRDKCPMSFAMLAPKYKSLKDAPKYYDKEELKNSFKVIESKSKNNQLNRIFRLVKLIINLYF